ncbi:MAG: hypothetical protein ACR2LN_02765 [Candidatus Levyibacteriota bacterium]
MDNTTIQKLKDAIAKSNSIGIAVGQNPSVDIMGAALALYLLLKAAKKQISIASPSDPIVEISSLVGIDKVQRNFGGEAGDMVVSFPYQEGEIEKVSYTLENNLLNIIVKASEQGLSFSEKDVHYSHGSGSIDLLIVVGAAQLNEIGDVIDSQKLGNVSIINIDNKSNNQKFGDIVLVSPQASSVSEHVADILLTLGFSVEQDAAQNLLSGIMTATKNFQDSKTSSLAFEVSAFLMKRGAQRIGSQPARYPQQNQQTQDNSQPQGEARPQAQQQNPQPNKPMPDTRPQQPAIQQSQAQPVQNQSKPTQPPQNNAQGNDAPPLDWLTPKVYKGSSDV